MSFESNVGSEGDILRNYADGGYYSCVFVCSESERKGYGNDVIVAWPSQRTTKTLERLNDHIVENNIDLSPYALAYPITMEDVVQRWEAVSELLSNGLSESDRSKIL
jgi:phosphohistidine phosphatase SixA